MKFVLWALFQSPNNSKTNFDWLLFSPILLLRRWKRWLKLSPKFVPSLKKLLWNSDNCCPIAFCHFEMQSNPNCLEITGERGLNWTTWCSRLRLGTVLDILQQWWSSGKVLRRVKGGKKNVLLSEEMKLLITSSDFTLKQFAYFRMSCIFFLIFCRLMVPF